MTERPHQPPTSHADPHQPVTYVVPRQPQPDAAAPAPPPDVVRHGPGVPVAVTLSVSFAVVYLSSALARALLLLLVVAVQGAAALNVAAAGRVAAGVERDGTRWTAPGVWPLWNFGGSCRANAPDSLSSPLTCKDSWCEIDR